MKKYGFGGKIDEVKLKELIGDIIILEQDDDYILVETEAEHDDLLSKITEATITEKDEYDKLTTAAQRIAFIAKKLKL